VANKAATAAAAPLSAIVQASFDAGEDPYGVPWAPGADGRRITLRKSGALARGLFYLAIGRKIRLRLPVPYAKYQVGKRRVAPTQGGRLPADYSKAISKATSDVIHAELGQ
jgi:hypothetical protein